MTNGKKRRKNKQSKHPLYWNCIFTCPFHPDEHLLWTESIMPSLSLSHFLKGICFFFSIPHAQGGQEPLALKAWSRGSSAGFPDSVDFISAPEALLLARENEIYWIVTLLTTAVITFWPLLYHVSRLCWEQKGSSTVSLTFLMKIYSMSRK